jgi:hypothetical protein
VITILFLVFVALMAAAVVALITRYLNGRTAYLRFLLFQIVSNLLPVTYNSRHFSRSRISIDADGCTPRFQQTPKNRLALYT